jgi:hypothetical protein
MPSIDTVDVDDPSPGGVSGALQGSLTMSIILSAILLICYAGLMAIGLIIAARVTEDKDE